MLPNKNSKFVSSQYALKNLEGKLLGLVDLLEVREESRSALKAALRQYVWGLERFWIPDERFDEFRRIEEISNPAERVMSNEELGQ